MNKDCRAYLPPEWSPQSGIMLTWPHATGDWGNNLAEVEGVFIHLAIQISRHEKVLIVCSDKTHQQMVERQLRHQIPDRTRILFGTSPSNDVWARDHGPITVMCSGVPQLLDFQFNGWGEKYPADLDNAISPALYRQGMFRDLPLETIRMVLEAGAIEVDGSGTLMATRRSVLSSTRNPVLSQTKVEEILAHYFGIERFIWLNSGALTGDDTDGHIDTLARFCDRDTIAYSACDNEGDANYASLLAMREELEQFHSVTNSPYKLVPLPLPQPKLDKDNNSMPATYANFLIINNAILVPTYDDAADEVALNTLQKCFPQREIIGINALPLIEQRGSLHCVTMQFPAGVLG
ncbi:MAG: agmatine/peptidylarginine deiminase [Acidiferrobacterales bacterium]